MPEAQTRPTRRPTEAARPHHSPQRAITPAMYYERLVVQATKKLKRALAPTEIARVTPASRVLLAE